MEMYLEAAQCFIVAVLVIMLLVNSHRTAEQIPESSAEKLKRQTEKGLKAINSGYQPLPGTGNRGKPPAGGSNVTTTGSRDWGVNYAKENDATVSYNTKYRC